MVKVEKVDEIGRDLLVTIPPNIKFYMSVDEYIQLGKKAGWVKETPNGLIIVEE